MNAKLTTLLAVILAALLIPAAQAKQGGNGSDKAHGKPSWAGQDQAKKAEKASRKTERKAAKNAAKADKTAGKRAHKAEVGESEGEDGPRHDNPAWICKFERDMIGDEPFGEKYGKNENQANAFGKCVSEEAHAHDGAGAEPEEEPEEPSVCNPTDEAGDDPAETESPESQSGALEEEPECPSEEEVALEDSQSEGTEMSPTESLLTVLRVGLLLAEVHLAP